MSCVILSFCTTNHQIRRARRTFWVFFSGFYENRALSRTGPEREWRAPAPEPGGDRARDIVGEFADEETAMKAELEFVGASGIIHSSSRIIGSGLFCLRC